MKVHVTEDDDKSRSPQVADSSDARQPFKEDGTLRRKTA